MSRIFHAGDSIIWNKSGMIGTIEHFVESGGQGNEVVIKLSDGEILKTNVIWLGMKGGWNHTCSGMIKSFFRVMIIKIQNIKRKV